MDPMGVLEDGEFESLLFDVITTNMTLRNHQVSLAIIGDIVYLVDVGFGGESLLQYSSIADLLCRTMSNATNSLDRKAYLTLGFYLRQQSYDL